ncbi:MAG: signal peptidase II [Calditrichaeota bacterium]|nr:MAG: signal peptidase II [Calditrichota bacterium]
MFSSLLIILGIFVVDQFSKFLALHYLRPFRSIPVVGDFFRLTYVENRGMAFGIDIENKVLFNLISFLAVAIIIYYFYRFYHQKLFRISFAIILGGAAGNLWDRLLHGKVIDFLDFEFFDIHFSGGGLLFWQFPSYTLERWPVFNIADMAVTLGMILILITTFIIPSSEPVLDNATREEI